MLMDHKLTFARGKFQRNKKVLLRERKRHTVRRVASTLPGRRVYLPWPKGGVGVGR